MVKKEVTKLLATEIIYPILDSQWVIPVQVVPKKSGMTIMKNQHDEMVPTMIQNRYMKIHIALVDQHKTTFMCPFGTFTYARMPFGCCEMLQGIVLGHLVSNSRIEVDKAKVDIIASLPNPTYVREVRYFLGHVGFYWWFIKNFNKIALPLSKLLQKDVDLVFDQPYVDAFQELKKRLTSAPILQALNWSIRSS
ncbi:putative mitochondrial protein, partial [Mucuna pruriens]